MFISGRCVLLGLWFATFLRVVKGSDLATVEGERSVVRPSWPLTLGAQDGYFTYARPVLYNTTSLMSNTNAYHILIYTWIWLCIPQWLFDSFWLAWYRPSYSNCLSKIDRVTWNPQWVIGLSGGSSTLTYAPLTIGHLQSRETTECIIMR
jgi:hypothetical protein